MLSAAARRIAFLHMKNTYYKIFLIVLFLIAAGLFCLTLYQALTAGDSDADSGIEPPSAAAVVNSTSTIPVRLRIPTLSVDAEVQQVGLTKSRAMGIPTNFTDAAWYKYGPVPGAIGNAVIDGHLDNAIALPGVFKHLGELKPGDDIAVTDASGQVHHFTVTRMESLPYNATSTAEIFGPSTSANLILITCGGKWNQSIKEYSTRLIVYSTFVE